MTPPEEKKERLKNCPFCGHKPNYSASFQDGRGGGGSIFCPNCRAGISIYTGSKNEVKELWNTRHSEEKVSVDNIFALLFNKRKSQGTFPTMEEIKILENYSESIADYVNGGKG